MKPLTHISVSSIQDYQSCPLRWCFRWLSNRVPRYEPSALTIGKAIHLAFQEHFTSGIGVGQALRDIMAPFAINPYLTENEQKTYAMLANLVEPLDHWRDEYPIEATLEVEQPFEIPLPNGLIFQGRPDRVVLSNGQLFHMQHKSIADSRNLPTYISVAGRALHELTYAHALQQKYPQYPYGGTLYNVVRKLQYRSRAKGKEGQILHKPEEFFLQTPISIDPKLVKQAWHDVQTLALLMHKAADGYSRGILPPSNRQLDEDMFSKRTDPYFGVLMGEESLEDEVRFMDREELYGKNTNEQV